MHRPVGKLVTESTVRGLVAELRLRHHSLRRALAGLASAWIRKRIFAARSKVLSSTPVTRSRSAAKALIRSARPCSNTRRPAGVAATITVRRSPGGRVLLTRPAASSRSTSRVIVGARTCSISASAVIDFEPPKTKTDKADDRAVPRPISTSCSRSRRSNCRAAECIDSATSSGPGFRAAIFSQS